MSKLITNNLRLFNVDQFIESFTEPGFNIYYFFVGNPLPFAIDNSPPTLYDNAQTVLVDSYENMIYGKRVSSNDVVMMARRIDWQTNTVYQKYTHDSNTLYSQDYFVVVDEGSSYNVFKCLDNSGETPSTDPPSLLETAADDDFYFTTDGYQWKYMYSITPTQFSKFSTSEYIPVYVNSNVVGNAVSGSIDNIEVVAGGNNYSSYANGSFQEVRVGGNPLIFAIDPSNASSNTNFYIGSAIKVVSGAGSGQQRTITGYTVSGSTRRVIIDTPFSTAPTTSSTYEITPLVSISGDGTGAIARAIVNSVSNTIYKIEVVDRGYGYTYASAVITGNTGVINVSTGTAITANSATAKIIISPRGGHGSNAAMELGSRHVGISVTFDSSLSGNKVVDDNDFRSIGILRDPLFSNAVLDVSSTTGTFTVGEYVYQTQGSPIAGIVITKPGSGYTSNATVTISGSSIAAAVANAQSNSTGRISQINISNNGQGYISPTATISAPSAITFNANTQVSNTDDFIVVSNNVFQNNDIVTYLVAAGNTALTNLSNGSAYYVVSANATGVKLSSTLNGSAINLTAGASEAGHSLKGETATVSVVVDSGKITTATGVVTSANDSVVKLSNVFGFFVTGNSSVNLLQGNTSGFQAACDTVTQPTTYFDQTYKVVGSLQSANNFVEDELVFQSENANAYFYSSNNTVVRLIKKRGTINQSDIDTSYYIEGDTSSAQFLVSGVVESDVVKGSGQVMYLENFTPVTKTNGQTETIKLLLEF